MSRVSLRYLIASDKSAVITMLQNAEVMRFLGPKRALSFNEASEWFETELNNPSRFAVQLDKEKTVIGFCGVKVLNGVQDFGYFFERQYWGNGYAREAVQLAVKALHNTEQLHVFIANDNTSSIKLATDLGWTRLQYLEKDGQQGALYQIKTGADQAS